MQTEGLPTVRTDNRNYLLDILLTMVSENYNGLNIREHTDKQGFCFILQSTQQTQLPIAPSPKSSRCDVNGKYANCHDTTYSFYKERGPWDLKSKQMGFM